MTLVERTLAGRDAAAIDRLDLYLRVYDQASASELSRRREKVLAACAAQQREPASHGVAEQIVSALVGWAEIVRPLLRREMNLELDTPAEQD